MLLLLIALPAPARAIGYDLDGDAFRDSKLHVSFTVPEGWRLSRQTGYPSLLAILTRPDGSRLSFSLATLERRQSMVQLLTDNKRGLQALRFVLKKSQRTERYGHQLWQLDWSSRGQRHRQAYIAAGARVYILSLSSEEKGFTNLVADFDFVLESLKARPWTWPEEGYVKERSKAGSGPAPQALPGPMSGPAGEALPELGGSKENEAPADPLDRPKDVSDRATTRPASKPATRPSSREPRRPKK